MLGMLFIGCYHLFSFLTSQTGNNRKKCRRRKTQKREKGGLLACRTGSTLKLCLTPKHWWTPGENMIFLNIPMKPWSLATNIDKQYGVYFESQRSRMISN